MLPMLFNSVKSVVSGFSLLKAGGIPLAHKSIRYFIDSTLREHVQPVLGSVLYCDLWVGAEHSGIYVGDGEISNIVVNNLLAADSSVRRSSPGIFTSKSTLGCKIYVSCSKNGAVGHAAVAEKADAHLGERSFYGLLFKNCHTFSSKCVDEAHTMDSKESFWEILEMDGTSGLGGILDLKKKSREKLGSTTWRLWDWDGSLAANPPPEPDWQMLADQLANQPLNPESIAQIREGMADLQVYEAEIADENIPVAVRQKLRAHTQLLTDIADKYEEVKNFLIQCPGADFSYAELKAHSEEFTALSRVIQSNAKVKELAQKMGRSYISEHRKKQARISEASRSEVHGTYRSADVMRLLPSELLNLEDEAIENLFYARLLEKQLQTYELQGAALVEGGVTEDQHKHTGPVVACLDTSGSMQGAPLLKAKALLLAIANILRAEQRSLHVLLFGSAGEMREFSLKDAQNAAKLLRFLQQGFGGDTDFETPLTRAMQIIEQQPVYEKADVLIISDGDCRVSENFSQSLQARKMALNCMVYSVLCNGRRVANAISDEVVVL